MEDPANSSAAKGKQVMEPLTAQNEDLGQNNNLIKLPSPTVGPSNSFNGSLKPIAQTCTSLEDSLLTVKDRIKNLEKGSGSAGQNLTLSKTPKSPLEIKHGIASGDNNLFSGQSTPSDPSISQQKCDFAGASLRSDIIMGKEDTSTVEGGSDISSMAQTSVDPKVYQSNSFSKLSASFDGGSLSFDRSMQHAKTRIHFRRSRHRRETGPYSTPEVHSSGMGGASSSFCNDVQNGEDSRHRQDLSLARDQEGAGLRMPDASIPISGCVNDATAQGNTGTIV
ncbi:hypothetical protein SLA2020_191600 [Shorea laevis]